MITGRNDQQDGYNAIIALMPWEKFCTSVAEAQALADVRAAAANAAVTAASTILSQSVKGSVADDLLAKGIAEVRAKLN